MELDAILKMEEEIFDEKELVKAFYSKGKSVLMLPGDYAIRALQHFSEYDNKELCKNKFTVLVKCSTMVIRRYDHGRTNSYYVTIT